MGRYCVLTDPISIKLKSEIIRMKNVIYLYVGYALFAIYILQDVLELKFQFLEELQTQQTYRRWSGVLLFSFILFQWSLTLVRVVKKWAEKAIPVYQLHKWVGAFSPVFYYLHATHLGYAYLLILSLGFFANFSVGLVNMDFIKTQKPFYVKGWMLIHVTLSMFISTLMIYHIWMVFYYN